MPLEAGQTLSHYRLEHKLGEGGMGVVWRALDTVLKRPVALKVLPASLATHPERRARFTREAQLLASLNHPNIGAIHGLEEAAGERFLVLELVEGETLADGLSKGALPIESALKVCAQIARAVEAAHGRGVVHRDLKPQNVMCSTAGKAKVLDFGLAKAFEAPSSAASTATTVDRTEAFRTREHAVLGTTAYMSPEQAGGQPVDERTDVWAFGCVLYETLTGRRAFPGATVTETLAAIGGKEPDWKRLPRRTPPRIRQLLLRCLAKDPDRRLHHIADARIEIADALSGREWESSGEVVPPSPARRWRVLLMIAGALAVGVAAPTIVSRFSPPGSSQATVTRLAIPASSGKYLRGPLISPDGTIVAYSSEDGLYVRRLDQFEPVLITEWLRLEAPRKAFSPDGRWLGFIAPVSPRSTRLQLMKVPLDGSAPPLRIADWPDNMAGGIDWLPTGDVIGLTQSDGDSGRQSIIRFPTDGSLMPPPVESDASEQTVLPSHFPDGRHVLTLGPIRTDKGERWGTGLLNVESGAFRKLIEHGSLAKWIPTGHLLFTRFDTLLAVPFDLERLETVGAPVAIMDDLLTGAALGAPFDVSANGTLVYQPGGIRGAGRRLATLTNDGQLEIWSEPHDPQFQFMPTVSDDGRRLAVVVHNLETACLEVWISPFDRPRLRRFIVGARGTDCWHPTWSPDGETLAYYCSEDGIRIRRVDGSDESELLLERDLNPRSFTPDGSHLLINDFSYLALGLNHVLMLPIEAGSDGKRTARTLMNGSLSKQPFSPDGRWIAYTSAESGRQQAYVREYRGDGSMGPVTQVTFGSADLIPGAARWSRREMELYFLTSTLDVMVVSVETTPRLVVSEPRLVLRGADFNLTNIEPLPDGRWIVILAGPEEYEAQQINVVQNWFVELERKLASSR